MTKKDRRKFKAWLVQIAELYETEGYKELANQCRHGEIWHEKGIWIKLYREMWKEGQTPEQAKNEMMGYIVKEKK